jgi:soluble lytic murein transglycosylase-like protein
MSFIGPCSSTAMGDRPRAGNTRANFAVARARLVPFEMSMRPRSPSVAAVVLAGAALALPLFGAGDARADIYKTVDADGVVHFTNSKGGGGQLVAKDTKRRVTPFMPQDVSIERFSRYDEWIQQAATLYQIPSELVRAVIMVESNYDPRALSTAGAIGLMQLMPETAARMEARDPHDPRENIFGGTRYLRILANLFNGDLELTIAGYNAGEGAVIRYGGIPPYAETQDYVVKVLTYYRRYRQQRDPVAASVGSSATPELPVRTDSSS